jgi:hypothetical protein
LPPEEAGEPTPGIKIYHSNETVVQRGNPRISSKTIAERREHLEALQKRYLCFFFSHRSPGLPILIPPFSPRSQAVMDCHIQALHTYNELKDIAQCLMGKLGTAYLCEFSCRHAMIFVSLFLSSVRGRANKGYVRKVWNGPK